MFLLEYPRFKKQLLYRWKEELIADDAMGVLTPNGNNAELPPSILRFREYPNHEGAYEDFKGFAIRYPGKQSRFFDAIGSFAVVPHSNSVVFQVKHGNGFTLCTLDRSREELQEEEFEDCPFGLVYGEVSSGLYFVGKAGTTSHPGYWIYRYPNEAVCSLPLASEMRLEFPVELAGCRFNLRESQVEVNRVGNKSVTIPTPRTDSLEPPIDLEFALMLPQHENVGFSPDPSMRSQSIRIISPILTVSAPFVLHRDGRYFSVTDNLGLENDPDAEIEYLRKCAQNGYQVVALDEYIKLVNRFDDLQSWVHRFALPAEFQMMNTQTRAELSYLDAHGQTERAFRYEMAAEWIEDDTAEFVVLQGQSLQRCRLKLRSKW